MVAMSHHSWFGLTLNGCQLRNSDTPHADRNRSRGVLSALLGLGRHTAAVDAYSSDDYSHQMVVMSHHSWFGLALSECQLRISGTPHADRNRSREVLSALLGLGRHTAAVDAYSSDDYSHQMVAMSRHLWFGSALNGCQLRNSDKPHADRNRSRGVLSALLGLGRHTDAVDAYSSDDYSHQMMVMSHQL